MGMYAKLFRNLNYVSKSKTKTHIRTNQNVKIKQ